MVARGYASLFRQEGAGLMCLTGGSLVDGVVGGRHVVEATGEEEGSGWLYGCGVSVRGGMMRLEYVGEALFCVGV